LTELGYQDGIEVSGEAVDIYRPQVLLADFAALVTLSWVR